MKAQIKSAEQHVAEGNSHLAELQQCEGMLDNYIYEHEVAPKNYGWTTVGQGDYAFQNAQADMMKEIGRTFRLDAVHTLADDPHNGLQTIIRLVPDNGVVGEIVDG